MPQWAGGGATNGCWTAPGVTNYCLAIALYIIINRHGDRHSFGLTGARSSVAAMELGIMQILSVALQSSWPR